MLLKLIQRSNRLTPKINPKLLFSFSEGTQSQSGEGGAPEITKENAQQIIDKWVK